jgi:hypothetical protein
MYEAIKRPLEQCKLKMHHLESENENYEILHEDENLDDFDQLNENNFKSWIGFL